VQLLALLLLLQHRPALLEDTVQPAQAPLVVQHALQAHIAWLEPQLLSLARVAHTRLTLEEQFSFLTARLVPPTTIALYVEAPLPCMVASPRQTHTPVVQVTVALVVSETSGRYQPPTPQLFHQELSTALLVTTAFRKSSASSFVLSASISQTRDNPLVFVAQQVHSVRPLA